MEDFNTSYITNLLTLSTDGLIIYFGSNGIDLKRNARFHYNIYHQHIHQDADGVNRLLLTSLETIQIGVLMINVVIILDNITLYNNGRNRERSQYLACISTGIEMKDWCLTPTLAIFQLYRGVNKNCIYRKTP